jgi:hypothetical protein
VLGNVGHLCPYILDYLADTLLSVLEKLDDAQAEGMPEGLEHLSCEL